jgi:hypothetical protein
MRAPKVLKLPNKNKTGPMTNAAEASAAASRGENVTYYHPSVGNLPASAMNQIAAQVSNVGWNFADFEDLLNTGDQRAITNFMNRLDTGTLSAAAGATVQSPKAPSVLRSGIGVMSVAEAQELAARKNKSTQPSQTAPDTTQLYSILLKSPMAIMQYLDVLNRTPEGKIELNKLRPLIEKTFGGQKEFKAALLREQEGLAKQKLQAREQDSRQPNAGFQAAAPQPQPQQGREVAPQPQPQQSRAAAPQPQQRREVAPQPPQPNALGGRDNIKNVPREQLSVLGKKLDVRQDYEYAGDQDDNRLEKDTRDPARTFRLAFANAQSGSVFEANGQKYRKY